MVSRALLVLGAVVLGALQLLAQPDATADDPRVVAGAVAAASGKPPIKASPADVAGDRDRPNVIFFLTDDLDASLMRYMPQTRRHVFDRGATFSRYFSNISLCCAARASILTGKYAHNTGIVANVHPDGFYGFHVGDERRNTFPIWVQGGRYTTALLGKYLNEYPYVDTAPEHGVNPRFIPNGWSEWQVPVRGQFHGRRYTLNDNGRLRRLSGARNYLGDHMAREVVRMVRRNRDDSGLMAMVSSFGPHGPQPASPVEKRDKALAAILAGIDYPRSPAFDEADVTDKPAHIQDLPALTPWVRAAIDREFRRRVRSVITFDRHVGAIVRELRRTRQLDNTYLVFTSDNGYHLGEHRLPYGNNSPYATDTHLPLGISGPGIAAGTVVSEVVGNIDLAPTFADMANVPVPPDVDGDSLLALAQGDHDPDWRRYYLMQKGGVTAYNLPNGEPGNPGEYELEQSIGRFFGVNSAEYTYVWYPDTDEEELYDLRDDPHQLDNLLRADQPEIPPEVAEIRAEMITQMRRLRGCAGAEECRD